MEGFKIHRSLHYGWMPLEGNRFACRGVAVGARILETRKKQKP
jgi:hypothetical protein